MATRPAAVEQLMGRRKCIDEGLGRTSVVGQFITSMFLREKRCAHLLGGGGIRVQRGGRGWGRLVRLRLKPEGKGRLQKNILYICVHLSPLSGAVQFLPTIFLSFIRSSFLSFCLSLKMREGKVLI